MFAPKKKLGQNFLKDKHAIMRMVDALNIQDNETLIEIGPGLGALTLEIESRFANSNIQIKLVEIDIRFVDKLKNMFAYVRNIQIIEANILDWLPVFESETGTIKIIGSLPYYITTPIIIEILKMKILPEVCVLLIQKEVVDKITSEPPSSNFLSTFVQTFYETEDLGIVDKKAFSPEPKVNGGILKLTKRQNIEIQDVEKYQKFLKHVYSNPRKMLNKVFYEDERNRTEIDGKLRPQNYGWEKWSKAFTILR